MLRVAMLSFWHVHAQDYAAEAATHPGVDLVAAWDEDAARGRVDAARWGLDWHDRLADLLARADIDGVIVTTPTTAHHDVIRATADAGKHIFTEKVLAPTLAETLDIVAAAERAGVVLTVSLPRLGAGYTRAIQTTVQNGRIGEITQLSVRLGHNGALGTDRHPGGWLPPRFFDPAQAGGGALIDLGCHPLYLLHHFLGMPESVSASYGYPTRRAVEDHAVVTLRYARGALGVAAVSFVDASSTFTISVHGTEGTMSFDALDKKLWLVDGDGRTMLVPLPADEQSPFSRWVSQIEQGTAADANIAAGIALSAVVEAANRSAGAGCHIAPEPLILGI